MSIRVALIFGGRSAEHDVSLVSAANILKALDPERYTAIPLGIDPEGVWHAASTGTPLVPSGPPVTLLPGRPPTVYDLKKREPLGPVDVAFPVLHGTYGEDGAVQGLLRMAGVPFVGPDILASAVCMDKEVSKRLLREAGLLVAPFRTVDARERNAVTYAEVTDALGSPLFVKPANLGSSVGISKVREEAEYQAALDLAFRFDRKVLVEAAITGAEIECAVLGNSDPQASLPGLVAPRADFYTYEAKYLDEHGASFEVPAKLNPDLTRTVQKVAVAAFRTLGCRGMARVDTFVTPDGEVVVNEVNTIPGFTDISMYPKLWEASGLPYAELLHRLITLAMQDFQEREVLLTRR
jgi:D-alanine-D-alanine ligase